jgi:biopolymer transport protein ExbD
MAISAKTVPGDQTVHYTPPRKTRGKGQVRMQPPLTPMIDVTFQLLLFFLLTCEFRESEGNIPGTLPAKGNIVLQQRQTPPPDPIRIRLRPSADRAAAHYEMTGVPVVINSPAELYGYLKQRQEQVGSDEVPVVILPAEDVPWEFVVEAFNQAVRARFLKIGFAQEIL